MGNLTSKSVLDCRDPTSAWEQLKHSTPVVEHNINPQSEPWTADKIRFVHISDTHSLTSHIESIPEGDVLLHTGDFTMRGDEQEVINFNKWLGTLHHKHKIVIAGNHELSFDPEFPKGENRNSKSGNTGKNGIAEKMKALLTNCIYLEDSSVTVYGLKIYGSPYQPEFGNWAFPLNRGQDCLEKWNAIPDDTDILMTHGPPLGIGDVASRGSPGLMALAGQPEKTIIRTGCVELLQAVRERVQPMYHLYGHIHEDYGVRTDGQTIFINAAYAGNFHGPSDKNPIVFDVALPEGQIKES